LKKNVGILTFVYIFNSVLFYGVCGVGLGVSLRWSNRTAGFKKCQLLEYQHLLFLRDIC